MVPTGEVADLHCCLEVKYEIHSRCLRLSRWLDQPHRLLDFIERDTPSGLMSGAKSALRPSGPIATWVGIPKDAVCWEGWRDFLDFLNHGILVETDEVKLFSAPNSRAS